MPLTNLIKLLALSVVLTGCASSRITKLPTETVPTAAIIEDALGSNQTEVRYTIAAPLGLNANGGTSTTARQIEDLNRDFKRVPNPEIIGFVYAHRVGEIPIPGYATVFPLYTREHYAVNNEGVTPERGE